MTRGDLRELRRIQRLQPSGLLAEFLRRKEGHHRPLVSSPQLVLALVTVECSPMHATITLAQCVARQEAKTPSGHGKGYPVHEACAHCPLREVHRALAGRFTPARYKAFNIAREAKQRAARQVLIRSGALDPVPTLDDPIADELGGRG